MKSSLFRAVSACLCAAATAISAELKPAEAQTVTQRVMGLFAPDREADLRGAVAQVPGVELVNVNFDHGEATFRYDPAVAFPGTKPADAPKRLDEKVRAASTHTFSLKPLDPTVAKDQLTRVEIGVAGLDCRACSLAAYEIVAKVEGVYQATASFKEGRVTALIDPNKTNRGALEEALKKRTVKVISAEELKR
jgi:copper chaperone CopZ